MHALLVALVLTGLTPEEEVEAWQGPAATPKPARDPTPFELGVGATIGASPIANHDVLLVGPGLGASLRGGRDILFSAALDVVPLPVFSASPRHVGAPKGLPAFPFAALAVGAGWRVVREELFEAGVTLSPYIGVGAYSCGDCMSTAGGVGVSPGAFVTFGARDGVRVTVRTQAPVGMMGLALHAAGYITVEPTFSWRW